MGKEKDNGYSQDSSLEFRTQKCIFYICSLFIILVELLSRKSNR